MVLLEDRPLLLLVSGVVTLLVVASTAGWILGRRVTSRSARVTVDNINARIRAWWVMALLFMVAATTGRAAAMYSITLRGMPSKSEQQTAMSAAASTSGTSERWPARITVSSSPATATPRADAPRDSAIEW